MNIKKDYFKILKIERAKNSSNGNPSYFIKALNSNDEYLEGKTASDSVLGYEVCYSWKGKTKKFCYHYTKQNKLIFNRVEG